MESSDKDLPIAQQVFRTDLAQVEDLYQHLESPFERCQKHYKIVKWIANLYLHEVALTEFQLANWEMVKAWKEHVEKVVDGQVKMEETSDKIKMFDEIHKNMPLNERKMLLTLVRAHKDHLEAEKKIETSKNEPKTNLQTDEIELQEIKINQQNIT